MIYVIMEGGICQGVCSDDPQQIGTAFTVIDYDCDQCDPHDDNIREIRQLGGAKELAFVGVDTIGRMTVTIGDKVEG